MAADEEVVHLVQDQRPRRSASQQAGRSRVKRSSTDSPFGGYTGHLKTDALTAQAEQQLQGKRWLLSLLHATF